MGGHEVWLAGICGILAGLGEREAAGLEQALTGALCIVLFHWKQRSTNCLYFCYTISILDHQLRLASVLSKGA